MTKKLDYIIKLNYDKVVGLGINIPEKQRKLNVENSMKSFVRLNDIVDQLKTLYNFTSMNPLDVLKNTGGISDILQTVRDSKNKLDELIDLLLNITIAFPI